MTGAVRSPANSTTNQCGFMEKTSYFLDFLLYSFLQAIQDSSLRLSLLICRKSRVLYLYTWRPTPRIQWIFIYLFKIFKKNLFINFYIPRGAQTHETESWTFLRLSQPGTARWKFIDCVSTQPRQALMRTRSLSAPSVSTVALWAETLQWATVGQKVPDLELLCKAHCKAQTAMMPGHVSCLGQHIAMGLCGSMRGSEGFHGGQV